ncbi:MAG TPA: M23 family metallopeptidase [Sphingomonadaceae bacterium]|nr:M23 family metallopeptidase [Sphingomonadaceae bacterium]
MQKTGVAGFRDRLKGWFPDREFFMRSQGQVRFIKVSSRVQIASATAAVGVLLFYAVSMGVMAISQYTSERDRLALLEREAMVASSESRLNRYRDDLDGTVEEIDSRMDFIEGVTETLDLPAGKSASDTVSDSSGEAAETVAKVGAAFPEARGLAEIEARQLAYVESLTRYADVRAARAASAIRQLGLNPDQMLRGSRMAMGGPLEVLSTNRDGSLDPRFERLALSLARMDALEESLEGIPQFLPAARWSISSGFGYRRDPFTGRAAMHSGLDFKAGYGAPIYAAAKGTVSFVGRKAGYGKVVEISHGNGLMTRYGHMSAFRAKVGQEVAAGDIIGAIGSTGRSTGPHLHFEVRVNDRALNPRPFLEKAPHVLEKARGSTAANSR